MLHRFFIMLAIGCSQSILAMDPVAPEQTTSITKIRQLNTQLINAIDDGDYAAAEYLLDAGAEVNARTIYNIPPLIWAVMVSQKDICELLIQHGAFVDAKDKRGLTALMQAALQGHDAICALLIKFDAQINVQTDEGAMTALLYAAIKGHESTCRLLIDHGAHPNASTNEGSMIFIQAVRQGHESTCKTLITYPMCNPFRSANRFKNSQQRIFTALAVLKRMCPALYAQKYMRCYILCAIPELEQDLYNSTFGYRVNRYNKTPFLSPRVIHLLIQNKQLDREATVAAIKAHHLAYIQPLILDAIPHAQTDSMRLMLNPNTLEKNFGGEIEYNIRRKLGLLSARESALELLPTSCSVQ